jgi:VIT1/CCC1 family predicted Fe2+/Mn2+ transporter
MAAGEYVSVQSQADTENADLARERRELAEEPDRELAELTAIYVQRGLDEPLARRVATTLMGHDALGAHSRDELGITETLRARSLQASMASAGAFAAGAAVPILATLLAPAALLSLVIVATTLLTLAALGATAAYAGGASVPRGALRVTFWGAMAMALTAGVGRLFGATV